MMQLLIWRFLLLASVVTALNALWPPAAGAQQTPSSPAQGRPASAPADQYFGRLHLSILGIRNTLKDLQATLDRDPSKAVSALGLVVLAEDALRDWGRQYPTDSWLADNVFALQRLYRNIPTAECTARAAEVARWLIVAFPSSPQARAMQAELTR